MPAVSENQAYGLGGFVRDVVLLAVGVVFWLGALMAFQSFGTDINGSTVVNRGTAVAQQCRSSGPLGLAVPGWWLTCSAEVRWHNGAVETREFTDSQLTEQDVGREVPVVERRIPRGAGKGSHLDVFRADFHPNPLPGYVLGGAAACVGSLLLIGGIGNVGRAVKRSFR